MNSPIIFGELDFTTIIPVELWLAFGDLMLVLKKTHRKSVIQPAKSEVHVGSTPRRSTRSWWCLLVAGGNYPIYTCLLPGNSHLRPIFLDDFPPFLLGVFPPKIGYQVGSPLKNRIALGFLSFGSCPNTGLHWIMKVEFLIPTSKIGMTIFAPYIHSLKHAATYRSSQIGGGRCQLLILLQY